jgi:putative methyltransferase (TIGR04325 family)
MEIFEGLHRAVDRLRFLPGIKQLRRMKFEREFLHHPYARQFAGVYATFDEALAHAPQQKATSFDNAESAERYKNKTALDVYDHPAMFWMLQSFCDGLTTVADVGGSIGMKFYAFGQYLRFPESLTWLVVDVPAVVELGRKVAAERNAPSALTFSADFDDAKGFDVLYCSGSVQYIPLSIGEILDRLGRSPRRIIVNTTPIHAERSFVTLNSMGTAICPYRVSSRADFVREATSRDYVLRDEWKNLQKDMILPFEEGYDVMAYSGFCFDRA